MNLNAKVRFVSIFDNGNNGSSELILLALGNRKRGNITCALLITDNFYEMRSILSSYAPKTETCLVHSACMLDWILF